MQAPSGQQQNQTKRKMRLWVRLALIAVVLVCAFLVVDATVFRIRKVTIIGGGSVGKDEIAAVCGLNGSQSLLFLKEDTVRKALDGDLRLEFISLQKVWPDQVILSVNEHIACTYVYISGTNYWTDENGFVIRTDKTAPSLLQTTGLKIRRAEKGTYLSIGNEKQYNAFVTVISEMKAQNCCGLYREINFVDTDKILLTTYDGYTISLGNADDMRAKLLTLKGVLGKLRADGYRPGALDVSVPGYATYTPPEL